MMSISRLLIARPAEPILKRKAHYHWPPRTNEFRSAYDIAKYYLLLCKRSYLNEEVRRTDPSPSVSVPCQKPYRRTTTFDLLVLSRLTTVMSAIFDIAKHSFYKTSYLNEEVNHTDFSPSVSVPWSTPSKLQSRKSTDIHSKTFHQKLL